MSKQTAVEWLEKRFYFTKGQLIDIDFETAKAMEREQIKESYKAGFNYRDSFNWECDAPWDSKSDLEHNEQAFEKYYHETYKGGEQ